MADSNNIPLGLKVLSQIPLDVKTYVDSEASLKNLGASDQLAFTYVQGAIFYCILEKTRYEWREVEAGKEDTGLLSVDYIYPEYPPVFGIDYSNKRYNFFVASFGAKVVFEDGENTTIEGDGSPETPLKINVTQLQLLEGENVIFEGAGTPEDPLKISVPLAAQVPQKNSDWNASNGVEEIFNKPTEFPPSPHIHQISEVQYLLEYLYKMEMKENKGQPLGYVPLDSEGKIDSAYIRDNSGHVVSMGFYDVQMNYPILPAANVSKGKYYQITIGGVFEGVEYKTKDWIISDGISWNRVSNQEYTDTMAREAVVSKFIRSDVEDQAPSEKAVYDELFALKNPDVILTQTGSTKTGQDIIYNPLWTWRIKGEMYGNPIAITVNFPLSSTGKTRIDAVIVTKTNTFLRVAGVESNATPDTPAIPLETILVSYVFVSNIAVAPPEPPVTEGEFVKKKENYPIPLIGGGGGNLSVDSEKAYFEVSGYGSSIRSIEDQQGYIYLGKEVTFRNTGVANLIFEHNPTASEMNRKFFMFPDETSFVLKPREVMKLKLGDDGKLHFVGFKKEVVDQIIVNGSTNAVSGNAVHDEFLLKENKNQKGIAGGYAPLDSNNKVPLIHINDALLGNVNYKGLWSPSTNTPDLTTVAPKGNYYICTTAGTRFDIDFQIGDWIISEGTTWSKVDNTDAVSSVFGRTGNITAQLGDYNTSLVPENGNLYFTEARVRATPLTGYALGSNAPIVAADTVLGAFGKVQAQLDAKQGSLVSGTNIKTVEGVNITGSGNAVLTNVAHLAGSETFTGLKTFNELPLFNKFKTLTNTNQSYEMLKAGDGTVLGFWFIRHWNGSSYVNSENGLALGLLSLEQNVGFRIGIASGHTSGRYNAGGDIGGILGYQSAQFNIGNNIGLLAGYRSARYNQGNEANVVGHNSYSGFNDNTANKKDVTSVDIALNRFTITDHGFGANGTYTNLRYTTTGTAVAGITNNEVYQFLIVDANTIEIRAVDITSTGTGTHSFTPQFVYSNVNIFGSNVQPTASNSSYFGNSSTQFARIYGRLLLNNAVDNNTDWVQANGTIMATGYKIPSGLATQALAANGGIIDLSSNVTGSGTANTIPLFTSSNVIGNSNIYQNASGNVGIGTSVINDVFVVKKGTGETRFGGSNGRELSAYNNGVLSNFDFIAVTSFFNSDIAINTNKKIVGSGDLLITTTNSSNNVQINRRLLLNTSSDNSTDWAQINGSAIATAWKTQGGTTAQFVDGTGALQNKSQFQTALTNPVTGTGTSGQISFWNGTNTQTSDSQLAWDNTAKVLNVIGSTKIRNSSSNGALTFENGTASVGAATGSITGGVTGEGVGSVIGFRRGSAVNRGSVVIETRGVAYNSNAFVVSENGNSLYGTSADNEVDKVQVNGNIRFGVLDIGSNSSPSLRRLNTYNYLNELQGSINIHDKSTNTNSTDFSVTLRKSDKSLFDPIIIKGDSGNVGIGTTTPLARLEVREDVAGNSTIQVSNRRHANDTLSSALLKMQLGDITENFKWGGILYKADVGFEVNASMRFLVQKIGTPTSDPSEIMRITSTGNVGINTIDPKGKFEVFTGLSVITTTLDLIPDGTISFINAATSQAAPAIVGKSNDSIGLIFQSGTNNINSNADMQFNVRAGNNIDYTTLTSTAFRFSRFGTVLIDVLRNGNTTVNGTISASPGTASNHVVVKSQLDAKTPKNFFVVEFTIQDNNIDNAGLKSTISNTISGGYSISYSGGNFTVSFGANFSTSKLGVQMNNSPNLNDGAARIVLIQSSGTSNLVFRVYNATGTSLTNTNIGSVKICLSILEFN
jgi:hypothetical protein